MMEKNMTLQEISPALVILSLRAAARGQKPHVIALKHLVLDYIESGEFSNLTPEDFAEARKLQRANNRRAARWAKTPPKDKEQFFSALTKELDSVFGVRRNNAKGAARA
jgi:hypothetical protein